MIKKLLMAAAVVVMAVPAAAQGSRRSEVSVSYGVAPVTDWIDSYSDMLTGLFTNANTDLEGWGAVTVGYSFRLIGSLRLGAGVRGNGPLGNLNANLILAGLKGNAVVRAVDDLLPNVKWNWMNLKVVSFYSRLGAGASFSRSEVGGESDKSTQFAFQVSPVGVEVGGRVAAYAEAGIGTSGCLLVGVRYRF